MNNKTLHGCKARAKWLQKKNLNNILWEICENFQFPQQEQAWLEAPGKYAYRKDFLGHNRKSLLTSNATLWHSQNWRRKSLLRLIHKRALGCQDNFGFNPTQALDNFKERKTFDVYISLKLLVSYEIIIIFLYWTTIPSNWKSVILLFFVCCHRREINMYTRYVNEKICFVK